MARRVVFGGIPEILDARLELPAAALDENHVEALVCQVQREDDARGARTDDGDVPVDVVSSTPLFRV